MSDIGHSNYIDLSSVNSNDYNNNSNINNKNNNNNSNNKNLKKRGPNEPEIAGFDKFVTIDWPEERSKEAMDKAQDSQNHLSDDLRVNHVYTNNSIGNVIHRYLKHIFTENWTPFIILTLMGISIGCIAGFIQIFTENLVNWKSGYCSKNWLLNKSFCCSTATEFESQCVSQGFWVNYSNPVLKFVVFLVLSVFYISLSALSIKYIAPMATGSGISEIKVTVSGFIYKTDFYHILTLLVKSIALPLTIASGISVGKEGPSVHYATCCGFIIATFFLKYKKNKLLNAISSSRPNASSSISAQFDSLNYTELSEYMIAGSAGGVAAAFGSPIGGVLFALEEIITSSDYNLSTLWKSYYVTMMCIATLKTINPFRNGKIVQFEVTYAKDWHVGEIPVFILLGIFGGVYGIVISKLNVYFVNFRKRYLANYQLQEVLIITVLTTFICYFNQFLNLDMSESMEILFHECVGVDDSTWDHQLCSITTSSFWKFSQLSFSLLFATVIRSALIVISYGCRVPCGIFVPSMAVGATFGRFISLLVERFITGPNVITPGTYAFLGAAASLSGITHLTLAVVVIMFELTGAFFYIIPTMIVVAVTRMVFANYGTGLGIAEQMIIFNGMPFLEDKYDTNLSVEYMASDIMTSTGLETLPECVSIRDMKKVISQNNKNSSHQGYPVITLNNKCVGYVKRENLETFIVMNNIDSLEIDFHSTRNINDINTDTNLESSSSSPPPSSTSGFLMDKSLVVIKTTTHLTLIHDIFKKVGPKVVMVENENGDLQGLITRKDLMKFERLRQKDLEGPLYTFNEEWDTFLLATFAKIKSKIKL